MWILLRIIIHVLIVRPNILNLIVYLRIEK